MSTMNPVTPVNRPRRPAAETRQLILDAAEDLFYWHGITATGVDRIAADAGVAPTTLYRLFRSKDDLVAAYVERYATGYRAWIESLTSDPEIPARDRILALFAGLADVTTPQTFRGCPFLMVLAEYPDPESAAHASAQAVKAWVRARLRNLVDQLPSPSGPNPPDTDQTVADQLALIVEGLYASTAALGANGPAQHAYQLAALVIDQHVSSSGLG